MFGQALKHARKFAAIAIATAMATVAGNAAAATGQLTGSPISNARFISIDAKGKITAQGFTTANGSFTYNAGNTVNFYIGDILLGQSAGAAKIPTTALVAAAKNSDAASNLLRFLQGMDSDGNALNGIQVTNTAHTYAKGLAVNFDAAMTSFQVQASLAKVLALAGSRPTLPQAVEALTNFRMALLDAYNANKGEVVLNLMGTSWTGTFSSTDCGATTTSVTHNFNILGHLTAGNHNLVKKANGSCGGANMALMMSTYENDYAFSCSKGCTLADLNRDFTLKFPTPHNATLVHQPGTNVITVIHHYNGRDVIETMVKK